MKKKVGKRMKNLNWDVIKNHILLMLAMILIGFLTDKVLLYWILPRFSVKQDWWQMAVLLIFLSTVWYQFMQRYTKHAVGTIDILDYPVAKRKIRSMWHQAIIPLLMMELILWGIMFAPPRDSAIVRVIKDNAFDVFYYIGKNYVFALTSSPYRFNEWFLMLLIIEPVWIWWEACKKTEVLYCNFTNERLYHTYKGLTVMYPDEIVRPFLMGEQDENKMITEWQLKKKLMDESIEKATNEFLKSERLKLELITNVSHDLKTPLTAIFNYLEIMRREDSLNEMKISTEYVFTLCEKLKNMIERLFDLSKASSGNVQLNLQTMDMNCLINQVYSDMEDCLKDAPVQFRLQLTNEPLHFAIDSRYAYSICQNLLENAVKYSMPGTRVYIRTKNESDTSVQLEILNTSAYEMDFSEDQITERFVRGDESRTTEGNGLGLAIVKAYTESCGGIFTISIDGDQFKATVAFPKIKKNLIEKQTAGEIEEKKELETTQTIEVVEEEQTK